MSYFNYLNLSPSKADLINSLGTTLDNLMTTDLNMTGRATIFYKECRKNSNAPLSTSIASKVISGLEQNNSLLFVTGCAVRPEIDLSIGEPDGPVGAAAIARSAYLSSGTLSVVVTANPLVRQVAATFKAAGAVVLENDAPFPPQTKQTDVFLVKIIGLDFDRNIERELLDALNNVHPGAVIAVEHLGLATDGRGYFSSGRPFEHGALQTTALFKAAKDEGIPCVTCFDNPNEVGTASLHSETTKHPPISTDFEFLLPGTSANWAASALAAAISALAVCPHGAFTENLDVKSTEAALQNGAIDPFSGLADASTGNDTIEYPYHSNIVGLMARAASGYISAVGYLSDHHP
ncbi:glutamate cyclase domain-containing protein [Stappia sp.]|uniref:glutamate cyclase domain-containing protein n=1 Tax=Stappia sp. TaxID=1870903 RepID=UPI003A998FA5